MFLGLWPITGRIFDKFQSFVLSTCVLISCDLMQIGCNSLFLLSQVVFWQNQATGGGKETPTWPKRARRLPDQGLRVQKERLLAVRQGQ